MLVGSIHVLLFSVVACNVISLQRLTSVPARDEFHRKFDRDGVLFLHFPSVPSFSQEPLRKITSYFKPRFSLHSGSQRSSKEEQPPPEGWPLSDPNSTSTLGSSPMRRQMSDHQVLAPADDTVQGPHQEHDIGLRLALFFYCSQPSAYMGGTAIFDMQRAWELLPRDLQEMFRTSFWRLPGIEDLPCAVRHPRTGRSTLVFYCFGRMARDCVDTYRRRTGKWHVREDPYSYGIHKDYDAMIVDERGVERPFIGLELYRTLETIYECMHQHIWKKGDALVFDNIRWAHARLEGSGSGRKIHFAWYGLLNGSYDPMQYPRPRQIDVKSE